MCILAISIMYSTSYERSSIIYMYYYHSRVAIILLEYPLLILLRVVLVIRVLVREYVIWICILQYQLVCIL